MHRIIASTIVVGMVALEFTMQFVRISAIKSGFTCVDFQRHLDLKLEPQVTITSTQFLCLLNISHLPILKCMYIAVQVCICYEENLLWR